MFEHEVVLTQAEYEAYVIACLETDYGAEYPDAAAFVTDDHQRFLDSRARLLAAGAAHLDRAAAAARAAASAEACRARELADFARSRPAAMFDRAPGELGAASAASVAARPAALTEVSEWAVDEAAATLGVSGRAASLMLVDAVTLVEGLPATFAALSAGNISPAHARAMIEIAGPVSDAGRRAAVEAAVLPRAVRQTPPALRACVRRAVARIDAAASADRLLKAVRDRHVRLDVRDDGMSALTALWTTPVARACHQALTAYAKACEYDDEGNRDPRSHDQRMSDCLTDLILRPHADHPAVRVALTLIAGVATLTGEGEGADEPGEVDGDLVPAALVRELAHTLGLLPRLESAAYADAHRSDPGEAHEDEPADSDDADDRIAALGDAELAAANDLVTALAAASSDGEADVSGASATRAALTRLLEARRLVDTALAERPRIAVADQLTGTLLALTDSTELRAAVTSGHGLGPPPGTNAYRPTDPLYRFVRLRDRRCRFPGCRVRARCCDLDHQVPHPRGSTTHDNLACLCEHHHRLSHQAPGWRLHRDADGSLRWTLPSGRTVVSRPPAFGTDDCSTPPAGSPARPGRVQRYDMALATIRNSRPAPTSPRIPF
jgi:hypothetical protein